MEHLKEKTAATEHPVHDLIARRWSPRAFADRPVPREDLLSLLEAARWAPSSYNEQPWSFLVATKDQPDEYKKLLDCLVEFNQTWAQTAPVLLISVAQMFFVKNDKPNRHALHDVGAAMTNLTLEATARDLYVHQMAGIEVEKTIKTFDIPKGFEPVAGAAIGYVGDPEFLPKQYQSMEKGPRDRKPLKGFVFTGKFRNVSALVEK